eukprot:GSChrysophyteH2.ASY1.ANO1.361.1 assembled CDS
MALHTMQPAAAGEEEKEGAEAEAEQRFAVLLRHLQPLKDKGATAAALESPASASRGADILEKRERAGKRRGNRNRDGGVEGGDVVPEADSGQAAWRADSEYTAVQAAKALLRPLMLQEAVHQFASAIAARKTLVSHSDLTSPADSYPAARVDKRRVIYHGGPTNSGKTYEALQRLRQADPEKGGGLYCGPLRLLALEVYESLNKAGVYVYIYICMYVCMYVY